MAYSPSKVAWPRKDVPTILCTSDHQLIGHFPKGPVSVLCSIQLHLALKEANSPARNHYLFQIRADYIPQLVGSIGPFGIGRIDDMCPDVVI